ncbi:MAG: AI-2E family transporter [Candidatus Woesearchaeota archaeon]|jgi:predicted PurR-regulated permease PerM|nr:AI-2E family transporter [Candidatus Woesearchaeota archaeon]
MYKIKKESVYLIILILFLSLISFFIIKKFIIPLLFTGILVYLFQPVYKKLHKIFRSDFLTSIIVSLIILGLIFVPMTLLIWEVSQEISIFENSKFENSLDDISNNINLKYNQNLNLTQEYRDVLSNSKTYFRESLYDTVIEFIFNIFIIIFFFYYFIKNYEKESYYFKIMFERQKLKEFGEKIKSLIDGIIYGQIMVRLIQASVGTVLFLVIGIKGAIIWGILMFFTAFLPVIGTALIWGPLLILNLVNGEYDIAFYLFIIGIIVSFLDNLLLPYIISGKTNIGPVITLISILGGIQLFGIYGLILGPFFLGLLLLVLEEFILKLRDEYPKIKRYVWSEPERKKFKNLNSNIARKEFVRMIHKKYVREEAEGKKIPYRYIIEKNE